jgi:SAM-dependent methyltransferase
MSLIDHIHQHAVYGRRIEVLATTLAPLLPQNCSVLDVGCGDGVVDRRLTELRRDVSIEGADVLVRPTTHLPVTLFNGTTLPYADASFDAVMFVDVLHHADDPIVLLREAVRVSRRQIVLKDHRRNGVLARTTLRFMDRVGNARHGVALPGNYWSEGEWRRAFAQLNLTVASWSSDIALYPFWATWAFGRSLHFVASVIKAPR